MALRRQMLEMEVNAGVAFVWLNRPPVNAVTVDMYDELRWAFKQPDDLGPDIRVVVLAGRGAHFCAGNDLGEFATMDGENADERMWHVREAFFAIQDCPVPVIAAVHGSALGTGLALAASCDYVFAAEGSRFGLPEITVGVMGGARHLARWVSQPMVRRAFFTGEPLTAEELHAVGVVQGVVPPPQLMATVEAEARLIARHSPTAVRLAKRGLNMIEGVDLKSGYAYEQRLTALMSAHTDSKEALASIRERRAPSYAPRHDLPLPPGNPAQW